MNNQQLLKLVSWAIGVCLLGAIVLSFVDNRNHESFGRGFREGYDRTTTDYESTAAIYPKDYITVVSPKVAERRIDNATDSLSTITGSSIKLVPETGLYSIWSIDENYENKPFYYRIAFVAGTIMYLLILIAFIRLISLFSKGEVLSKATYKNLLILAICVILVPVFDYGYEYMDYMIKRDAFSNTNYQIVDESEFKSLTFILGLVFLGLVIALKIGVSIKEENELTI